MRASRSNLVFLAVILSVSLGSSTALAQPEPTPPGPVVGAPPANPADPTAPMPASPPPAVAPSPPAPTAPAPTLGQVVHPDDERRKEDLTPHPSEPPASKSTKFTADPIGDTGVILLGLTFGILSNEILSTGEIRPQQISANFTTKHLLGIDRGAITQTLDSNANSFSNYGLYAAAAYALFDTVADGFREGKAAALTDAVMYIEAVTITQGVTNLAKIAFRRPRPIAYIARNDFLAKGGRAEDYDNGDTDSTLSFFSGHSSATASLASAATYIAFARSGTKSVRPWLTLAGGTLLTSFVAYERVRGGDHFPTDVIAGALAGTAVGALVVHLHREDSVRQRPVWIGVTPSYEGGMLTASGLF